MRKPAIKLFAIAVFVLLATGNVKAAVAAPRLTLTPISGSYTNGSTFTVAVGVNSDTEKSSAVDVWSTFDATKLEIVSIVKSSNPPYSFDITPRIDNVAGKFSFSCNSDDLSTFSEKVIVGELAVITFKTKALGTANVNFVCTQGSTTDSNIFNSSINDVITCASNDAGSYVITAGASTTTVTPTQTPTPTTQSSSSSSTSSTSTSTPTSAAQLPQTGGIASTLGLIIFGAVSLASAVFLKFL